jgi:hypothetical protein
MKLLFFILSISSTLTLFGQKQDIENLINQIAAEEVPGNFKYYFLVPKGLEQPQRNDSLQNHEIRELKMKYKDFPEGLLYKQQKETIDWENYSLNNVHYTSGVDNRPSNAKKIKFVNYNIDPKKYDSLNKNKEPYTLILKKKWLWNKKRIWNNNEFLDLFLKTWKEDDINHPEEAVYFHFSNPVFSENKKFALVSVSKKRACTGKTFTGLYRNDKGVWEKIVEYESYVSKVFTTHHNCEDKIIIDYE